MSEKGTWPITNEDVKDALGLTQALASAKVTTQQVTALFTPQLLEEIAEACSRRVDHFVGRFDDPHAWEDEDGKVPSEFRLAAMDLASTWWQQTRNGPRQGPTGLNVQPGEASDGIRGIGWPRRARSMLEPYQALPGTA